MQSVVSICMLLSHSVSQLLGFDLPYTNVQTYIQHICIYFKTKIEHTNKWGNENNDYNIINNTITTTKSTNVGKITEYRVENYRCKIVPTF